MKSLLSVSGAVLCALVMTACATDDPPTSVTDPAVMSPDVKPLVTIPRELSLEKLDGQIKGNQFTGTTNACHVTLLFCHDPRLSPSIPSFCQNGGCSTGQAVSAAFSLCDQICGVSACDVIAQFPNSPSC